MFKRGLILSFVALFAINANLITASESYGVLMATDLKNSSSQARELGIPMMMFFAAEDCGYCERLENDYLRAMSKNEEYQNRVIIRKVVIDSYDDFRDFGGDKIEASDFSDKFNIQVTPTLVFVDPAGKRVADKIIGYQNSGFFGAELDKQIELATKSIR